MANVYGVITSSGVAYSTDLITWKHYPVNIYGGEFSQPSNGRVWRLQSPYYAYVFPTLAYDNGLWVLVLGSSTVSQSAPTSHTYAITTPMAYQYAVWTSPNLRDWTKVDMSSVAGTFWNGSPVAKFFGTQWMLTTIIGSDGAVTTPFNYEQPPSAANVSTPGWQAYAKTVGGSIHCKDVTYGYVVFDSLDAYTGSAGTNFNGSYTTNLSTGFWTVSVVWDGTTCYVLGFDNTANAWRLFVTSNQGSSWTQKNLPTNAAGFSRLLRVGGKLIVVANLSTKTWASSNDGTSWVEFVSSASGQLFGTSWSNSPNFFFQGSGYYSSGVIEGGPKDGYLYNTYITTSDASGYSAGGQTAYGNSMITTPTGTSTTKADYAPSRTMFISPSMVDTLITNTTYFFSYSNAAIYSNFLSNIVYGSSVFEGDEPTGGAVGGSGSAGTGESMWQNKIHTKEVYS